MIKLYKLIDNKLYYWETWDNDDKSATVHWGIVGERGQDKEVKGGLFSNFRKLVQKEMDERLNEGYEEIDEEDMIFLEIQYMVDGFGTEEDLAKRHRFEERMNELLGWTGLGHVDGGSIGTGGMEVCCGVVDFNIAKATIEEDLKGTEFANYAHIVKVSE